MDDIVTWHRAIRWTLVLLAIGVMPACSQEETASKGVVGAPAGAAPVELREGEQKFVANCSRCHGLGGVGTDHGPPLVHKIYEPNHHADAAFHNAAANGVRAHHWQFGNMPKVEGVTTADVEQIVKYVRWLQKQAGIF
ncbi:MAG: cytochrome c [Nitrospira sp.]|nr:cytochrome c [Nitrospira sp.]